jgi:hypothetical protein
MRGTVKDVRFIKQDGASVDAAIVRKHFFESAVKSGASPLRATRIWNDALFGDPHARELIEEICGIEIVEEDAGFGFLK